MRWSVATGLLLALVFTTPFFNWNSTAVWVNTQIALMQLLFAVLLLPEVKLRAAEMYRESQAFRLTLGIAFVASLGCALVNPSVLQESRFWLYGVQLFFFIAAVVWFTAEGDRGVAMLACSKLLSVALVCAFFLWAMYVNEASSWRDIKFPIYRNVRHFNYDLAAAVIYLVLLWSLVKPSFLVCSGFFIFAALLGFVCLFTEGRGQLLNTLLFFAAGFCCVTTGRTKNVFFLTVMGFLLGAVLLAWMYPDTLSWLLARSLAETPDRVSAGRITMWTLASEVWLGSPVPQLVFGLGPDSFRLLKLSPGYVHPHNSVIQVGMEFGIVGMCLLIYIAWHVLRGTFRTLQVPNEWLPKLVATALLSMGCYSLLDGIIYHGGPFLVCVLMGAYLFVSAGVDKKVERHSL